MADIKHERVGPITSAHEAAREQLCREGSVVTFRRNRRTVGETWWRTSRTGPKQGDVTVCELDAASPTTTDLAAHCDESGFESVDTWRRAIETMNGHLPASGYLYRVTVQGNQEDDTA